jgi:hypothetical protein
MVPLLAGSLIAAHTWQMSRRASTTRPVADRHLAADRRGQRWLFAKAWLGGRNARAGARVSA